MITVFIVLQVLIAISLVLIILLQHGKGADIGSAFGGGNNNAMFAPADATNILTKITWGLVIAFFSITIAISAYQKTSLDSELEVFKNSQSQEIIEEKPLIEDLPE
tara:strand:+ start:3745 stop:4062 length:318 start_codon:yes stop_codon:yes gene_type:complete